MTSTVVLGLANQEVLLREKNRTKHEVERQLVVHKMCVPSLTRVIESYHHCIVSSYGKHIKNEYYAE